MTAKLHKGVLAYLNPLVAPSSALAALPITIFQNPDGSYFTPFDVAAYQWYNLGKTYYVDAVNGLDTYDGTELVHTTGSTGPFKTISKAVGMSDVDIIMVNGGLYTKDSGLGGTITPTRSMSIIAVAGTSPVFSLHYSSSLTWTLVSGTTYSCTRSNVGRVFDAKYPDEYGDFLEYSIQTSAANVEATPGSWYDNGTTLYVNCIDGRTPQGDSYLRPYANTSGGYPCVLAGNITLYMQGIEVDGGSSCVDATNASGAVNFYAKNCAFKYSCSADALKILGAAIVYTQNCVAARSYNDGFGYHANLGTIPKFIEVNNTGRNNGASGTWTDNGSTCHDGSTGIRLNCTYFGNAGPNVADSNDGTQSWNVHCVSGDSVAFCKGFCTVAAGVVMMVSANMPFLPGMATAGGSITINGTAYPMASSTYNSPSSLTLSGESGLTISTPVSFLLTSTTQYCDYQTCNGTSTGAQMWLQSCRSFKSPLALCTNTAFDHVYYRNLIESAGQANQSGGSPGNIAAY